ERSEIEIRASAQTDASERQDVAAVYDANGFTVDETVDGRDQRQRMHATVAARRMCFGGAGLRDVRTLELVLPRRIGRRWLGFELDETLQDCVDVGAHFDVTAEILGQFLDRSADAQETRRFGEHRTRAVSELEVQPATERDHQVCFGHRTTAQRWNGIGLV